MIKNKTPITLGDGKHRTLYYGFNALIELVETLGISLDSLQEAMTGPGSLKAVRNILWAGLIHEDKTLTPEQVGDLLDGELHRIAEISGLIVEAIAATFGPADGGPKNAETPVATIPAASL